MTLYKWVRDYIKKLSYITRTEFKNGKLYLYYEKDGKEKYETLPYRATPRQVLRKLEKIKGEINYYEEREEYWKDKKIGNDATMIYTYGETNE